MSTFLFQPRYDQRLIDTLERRRSIPIRCVFWTLDDANQVLDVACLFLLVVSYPLSRLRVTIDTQLTKAEKEFVFLDQVEMPTPKYVGGIETKSTVQGMEQIASKHLRDPSAGTRL